MTSSSPRGATGSRPSGNGGGDRATDGFEWVKPDKDEEFELAARMGDEHESRYLAKVRASEPRLAEIARNDPAATERMLAAMRGGGRLIQYAENQ